MVLITTMMAICLTLIMLYSLLQSTGINKESAISLYYREAALQAAQSGMDYAVCWLQKNSAWRGDSNCRYWTGAASDEESKLYGNAEDGCLVEESYGNVVGLMKATNGTKAAFRIKFNYEDNASKIDSNKISCSLFYKSYVDKDKDNRQYPIDTLKIAMPYVSVNNLNGSKAAKVYRANLSGEGLASSAQNLEWDGGEMANREFANCTPPYNVCLIVEGIAGNGLRDCESPEDVRNAADNSKYGLVRRYIEAYYTPVAPIFHGYASVAYNDFSADIGETLFVSSIGYSDAKEDVDSILANNRSGYLRSDNSTISVAHGKLQTYFGGLVGKIMPIDFISEDDDKPILSVPNDELISLDWSDVVQADGSSSLQSGFYRWDTAGTVDSKPIYELRYYPDGFNVGDRNRLLPKKPANYKVVSADEVSTGDTTHINIAPLGRVVFPKDDDGNIMLPTLKLKGSLYCNGDFALCSNPDNVTVYCPELCLEPYYSEAGIEEAVLTTTGKMSIFSALNGEGAITTKNGDVSIIGTPILHGGISKLAIYGNNINVEKDDCILSEACSNLGMVIVNPVLPLSVCEELAEITGKSSDDVNAGDRDLCLIVEDYFKKLYGIKVRVSRLVYDFGGKGEIRDLVDGVICIWKGKILSGSFAFFSQDVIEAGISHEGELPTYNFCYIYNDAGEVQYHCYTKKNANPPYDSIKSRNMAITVPIDAVVDTSVFNKKYGSVSYKDAKIGGVIYAKNKININLDYDCSLAVCGTMRSETDSITMKAKYADLIYDETCANYVLSSAARYRLCQLRRVFWNCW